MQKLYCTIFIVDVSQNPEEVDTVTSRIVQLIEDHGGVIKRQNPWGKRRLAYPIRKKTSGYYVEIEFTAHSHLNIPKIIEQEYRLNDRVLRYLTYVVTPEELRQRELTAKQGKATAAREVSKPAPASTSKPAEKTAPTAEAVPAASEPAPEAAEPETSAPAETTEEEQQPTEAAPPAETAEETPSVEPEPAETAESGEETAAPEEEPAAPEESTPETVQEEAVSSEEETPEKKETTEEQS